jgi:hypothetical protein
MDAPDSWTLFELLSTNVKTGTPVTPATDSVPIAVPCALFSASEAAESTMRLSAPPPFGTPTRSPWKGINSPRRFRSRWCRSG